MVHVGVLCSKDSDTLRIYRFALEFWWNASCMPVASRQRFEEPDYGLTGGALRPNAVTASLEESAKVQGVVKCYAMCSTRTCYMYHVSVRALF